MDNPSTQTRRARNSKRTRVSESGNGLATNNGVHVQVQQVVDQAGHAHGLYSQAAFAGHAHGHGHGHAHAHAGHTHAGHTHAHAHAHAHAPHRANGDDTVQPPTFPSQQLDVTVTRPHHLGEPDGLMNGYSAPHTQYPEPTAQLSPAVAADVVGVAGLNAINNGLGAPHHAAHSHHPTPSQQQQQQQQQQSRQQLQVQQQSKQSPLPQQQQLQQQQQRSSVNNANKTSSLFQQEYAAAAAAANNNSNNNNNAGISVTDSTAGAATTATAAAATATAAAAVANANANATPATTASMFNLQAQAWAGNTPGAMSQGSPGPATLQPPPEGIYRSFEDLLSSVQKLAKDQGYGVVKLRASNYRDGKPTRYDLVCDRGGVKYSSTAKKRNPSTRKVDCPWRAKAVCEVQLGNQWRFAVQESRHNHEPRVPAAPPGQENTPVAQNIRSMTNKLDRMQHDMSQGFQHIETLFTQFTQQLNQRIEGVEKRLDILEGGGPRGPPQMLAGNTHANLGTPNMPPANMGGPGMGNGGMGNGGLGNGSMVDNRLQHMEARMSAMEQRQASMGVDGMMLDDESASRLMMGVSS